MFSWIARKWNDFVIALTIILVGRSQRESFPIVRGKLLVQDAHDPEQVAKMPKGYKLVAFTAVVVVPKDDPRMANGQLNDVIGAMIENEEPFPMVTLSVVASHNIIEHTKGKDLGAAFNLPIWKF